MWPIRLIGAVGFVVCPPYAVAIARNPDLHEKPLLLVGVGVAFLFSCMQLVIKPRARK
jgi:hypothetical protein